MLLLCKTTLKVFFWESFIPITKGISMEMKLVSDFLSFSSQKMIHIYSRFRYFEKMTDRSGLSGMWSSMKISLDNIIFLQIISVSLVSIHLNKFYFFLVHLFTTLYVLQILARSFQPLLNPNLIYMNFSDLTSQLTSMSIYQSQRRGRHLWIFWIFFVNGKLNIKKLRPHKRGRGSF